MIHQNANAGIFGDRDGTLGVLEFSKVPFIPKRLFWITGVSPDSVRANHAHKTCHQLLICMSGSVKATIITRDNLKSEVLLSIGKVLHLEPMNWLQLHHFSEDGVLGVLASEPYDPCEYINNLDDFISGT